jgi:error-prone DNA polymerase
MDLLFERFLSEERGEWPDIDLDLPSGDRREAIIQYVYGRYGGTSAAMTANVITYQPRRAVREVGKALGLPPDFLDRLAKDVPGWGYQDADEGMPARHLQRVGADLADARIRRFAALWHASSGSRAISASTRAAWCSARAARRGGAARAGDDAGPRRRPVGQGRLRRLGIIKVDLLGLGMMAALEEAIELCRAAGREVDLAHLPPDDPAVYRLLQAADTVGLFQVESRAQMATLPRLRPRRFYDLVVQVAIIRPGPDHRPDGPPVPRAAGGPSARRLSASLARADPPRTLGVPLFQEQLLRMGMVAAGLTGGEAEELRRAFGFRRSRARMQTIEAKLRAGIARNGITGPAAEEIVREITAFAEYGFPESHAASFALLAYASAYLKVYHPPSSTRRSSTTSRWASTIRRRWSGTRSGAARRAAGGRRRLRLAGDGRGRRRAARARAGEGAPRGGAARLVAARQAQAFTSVDDLARAPGSRGTS